MFGKGFQKDVLYVSNDDYGAIYHLMDKLSLSKIKTMWLLMGGKNSVNMERVRGAEEWLEQHSSEVELETIYGLSTIESVYSYSYNHLKIMSGSKTQEERRFYINLAIRDNLAQGHIMTL